MTVLMVSIFCLSVPLALGYGLHARRSATQKGYAWVGLVLALLLLVPFSLMIIGSVLNVVDWFGR